MNDIVFYACQSTHTLTYRYLEFWCTDTYLRNLLETRLNKQQLHPTCYKEIIRRLDNMTVQTRIHLPSHNGRGKELVTLEVISQAEFEQHRREAELSVNPNKHISDELIVY